MFVHSGLPGPATKGGGTRSPEGAFCHWQFGLGWKKEQERKGRCSDREHVRAEAALSGSFELILWFRFGVRYTLRCLDPLILLIPFSLMFLPVVQLSSHELWLGIKSRRGPLPPSLSSLQRAVSWPAFLGNF